MTRYVSKRILMSVLTLFVLIRIMPSNPFPVERMSAEMILQKRAELGLDKPILIQFVDYLSLLASGSFGNGTSLYNGAPIKPIMFAFLENSFKVGVLSILFTSILGVCIPSYVFMIFLQYFFAYKNTVLPVFLRSVAIFTETFLSFVGVIIILPQQILPPISVLAFLMFGFNLIGDGFHEALAPKLEDM